MKLRRSATLLDRLRAKNAKPGSKFVMVLRTHLCLVDLKAGRGQEDDWNALHSRLVYGMQLSRDWFNHEAIALLFEALLALSRSHSSAVGREGLWTVVPEEAQLLGLGLVLTDEMEQLCTSKELHGSYAAAQARL